MNVYTGLGLSVEPLLCWKSQMQRTRQQLRQKASIRDLAELRPVRADKTDLDRQAKAASHAQGNFRVQHSNTKGAPPLTACHRGSQQWWPQ